MNEEKLYYTDTYLRNIDSTIVEIKPDSKGTWLRLDKTIFYPGGGGQLPDRGQINDVTVFEVKEEKGHVWHKVNSQDDWQAGQKVRLKLDWPWRYYNMQQHSGQHLLSRLMESMESKTVSVHLGEEYTLIEVEGAFPDENQMLDIEEKANILLREALPIITHEVSRRDIKRFPLRKPPGNWQQIRVVEIKDYDYSACGGTHVQHTAEIGFIKWLGTEKIRGHARIKWLIGQKADAYLRMMHATLSRVKAELQCEPQQFAERVAALKKEVKTLRKALDVYKRSHLRLRSRELYETFKNKDGYILCELRAEETSYLSDLAKIIAGEYSQVVFLFTKDRFCLVAPDTGHLDTGDFLDTYRDTLGLRGGGPPGFAQGAINQPDAELIAGCLKAAMGVSH